MALTGELSDLSLAELIEFFCNQRKSGRLKVIYSGGPGYFYLQSGSVVHAKLGALRGIDAVYYALTLPNASFKFSAAFEPPERTINQPWTSVVLEGLRRMDEGVEPANPFPADYVPGPEDLQHHEEQNAADTSSEDVVSTPDQVPTYTDVIVETHDEIVGAENLPWLFEGESRWLRKPWGLGAVVAAVVLILAVIGIPWGWYVHNKGAKNMPAAATAEVATQPSAPVADTNPPSGVAANPPAAAAPANAESDPQAARRLREARTRERARTQESATDNNATAPAAAKTAAPVAGPKKVTIQVSYDENGRVTQASGGDANALRIARQKRFPAGKPGSATITIPIN